MEKYTHTCCICDKKYKSCDYCNGVQSYAPWRTVVDSIDHYKVFLVVKQYNEKVIDKETAKSQLKNVDTSGWEDFKPSVVEIMREILEDTSPTEEVKTKTIKSKK